MTEKDGETAARTRVEIDLGLLAARASGSDSKEAYQLVSDGGDYRLGVIAMEGSDGGCTFSIELLVCILGGADEIALLTLEKAVEMAEVLKARGYTLTQQNDGWITCERHLPGSEVAEECGALLELVAASSADDSASVREGDRRGNQNGDTEDVSE